MNTNKIYIKTWAALKPYEKQAKTDLYYLKICNEVKRAIVKNSKTFSLNIFLEPEEIDTLCCFLTSYFEDVISGTNIWNSFVRMHRRLYEKPIPFYDTSEYYDEEVNIQDVSFLIWYFLNTVQDEEFIGPLNDSIIAASEDIFEVFDNAWEYAPENDILKTFYSIDENETDFYTARSLIDALLFNTYLFLSDTAVDLSIKENEIIEEVGEDENLLSYLNDNRDNFVHNGHTRLLALRGTDWISEILTEQHPLSKHFKNLSPKITGYFFYKGQDEQDIFIEHIASGKKFNMTKKSFDHYQSLKEIDAILFMGIVQWMGEWWFSGIFFSTSFNADLVLDEKNSINSRKTVSFLDNEENELEEILEEQLIAFKDFNGGSQIAFMNADQIDSFLADYMQYYNESLGKTEEEIKEAKKRARKEGYFGNKDKKSHFEDSEEHALVFFNPKSGPEIALTITSAFPDDQNPYYSEEESEDHIIYLLLAEELSPELVRFCIENYKDKLPLFKRIIGKTYLENLDFILRFSKRKNYHTKPQITLTGKNYRNDLEK